MLRWADLRTNNPRTGYADSVSLAMYALGTVLQRAPVVALRDTDADGGTCEAITDERMPGRDNDCTDACPLRYCGSGTREQSEHCSDDLRSDG